MIVIANSSPLIALGRVKALHVLQQLFGNVLIPKMVYQETVVETADAGQREAIQQAINDGFIRIVQPSSQHVFMRRLHAGEQDVLNAALELHADMLILDDKKARNEAKALGFDVYYTSAILKGAEKRGLIVSAAQLIAELRKIDIYLPEV